MLNKPTTSRRSKSNSASLHQTQSGSEFGVVGFVPLEDWDESQVIGVTHADVEGVYVVVRESTDVPTFLDQGHRKPRPKRWSADDADDAADRWVPGVQVLYFGKGPLRPSKAKRRQGLARRRP